MVLAAERHTAARDHGCQAPLGPAPCCSGRRALRPRVSPLCRRSRFGCAVPRPEPPGLVDGPGRRTAETGWSWPQNGTPLRETTGVRPRWGLHPAARGDERSDHECRPCTDGLASGVPSRVLNHPVSWMVLAAERPRPDGPGRRTAHRCARPRVSGPAGACTLLLGATSAPTTSVAPVQTVSLRVCRPAS